MAEYGKGTHEGSCTAKLLHNFKDRHFGEPLRVRLGGRREAVLDRDHLVLFDPLPLEVHQRVGDWFWCQELYDYIGDRLHMLDRPAVRTYLKAWERQQAGGNWKKQIADVFCHNNTVLLVQALESDLDCGVVDDRVRTFIDPTGLSRATNFNIKRELKNNDQLTAPTRIDVHLKAVSLRSTATVGSLDVKMALLR